MKPLRRETDADVIRPSLSHNGLLALGCLAAVKTLAGSLDNVVRPLLIKKGLDLPLALVFSGVIGGLIAFGPVGLFAGPMVLAVAHTLLRAWVAEPEIA